MGRLTDTLAGSPQRPENARGTQIYVVIWVTESDRAKCLFPIGTLPLWCDLIYLPSPLLEAVGQEVWGALSFGTCVCERRKCYG